MNLSAINGWRDRDRRYREYAAQVGADRDRARAARHRDVDDFPPVFRYIHSIAQRVAEYGDVDDVRQLQLFFDDPDYLEDLPDFMRSIARFVADYGTEEHLTPAQLRRRLEVKAVEDDLTTFEWMVLGYTGSELLELRDDRVRDEEQLAGELRMLNWFDDHEDELRDDYAEVVPWWRHADDDQFGRYVQRRYRDLRPSTRGRLADLEEYPTLFDDHDQEED